MLFPAFLVILLAAATAPALSAQRAQAAVPANAELHLFPLEPEKELGSGWRAKLGLMPDRLSAPLDLYNYHRETKRWVWETLPAGTVVLKDAAGVVRYKVDCMNRVVVPAPAPAITEKPEPPAIPAPPPSAAPTREPVTVNVTVSQEVGGVRTAETRSKPEEKKPGEGVQVNVNVSQKVGEKAEKPGSPLPAPPARREPKPRRESVRQWAPTAGALAGPFDSEAISGVWTGMLGREFCAQGRSFDIGLAYGKPGGSLWRFSFAGVAFDDRSFSRYSCEDCDLTVTVAARSARVWGFRAERVFRIVKPTWPVAPMFTLHGGAGRATGRAIRMKNPVGNRSDFTRETVAASRLLDSEWFPIAGGGAGVMGDIGQKFTWGFTAVGVEFPGVYFGGVQLTYWFK